MITVMTTAASKYPTENESYLQIKTNMKQLQDENRGLRWKSINFLDYFKIQVATFTLAKKWFS